MQDEQRDILYRAAEVWKELTEYHYVFTYGYKSELHEIKLTFSLEDFPHLAGFHYLKELALPRYSLRKTVDMMVGYFNGHDQTLWVMVQGLIQTLLVRLPLAYYMSIQPNASLTKIGFAAPVSTIVGIVLNVAFYAHYTSNMRGKLKK